MSNARIEGGPRRSHRAAAEAATRRERATRRRARALAVVLTPVLAIGTVGLGVWGATVAAAAPLPAPAASIALQDTGGAHGDADAKPFILAGEDATFDLSLANIATSDGGYNVAFTLQVPNGIAFVASGGMGSPVVYASGATLPNSSKTPPTPLATVPEGQQLWVFEDISDLPATADYASTVTVRPDAAVFSVGASPDFRLTGYVSSDATLKPIFDGSTGVGGAPALAETSSGFDETEAPVRALRLTKHEPSPEIELLRGVHANQTAYTLTVESTPQGVTDTVTIVDYIPAGLEFLGCATADNTLPSSLLYSASGTTGGVLEYPGSGDLVGTDPGDCILPTSVETVDSGIPADIPAGVYTRIEWQLPGLSGTTAQAFPATAGVPATYVISYRAAVPLFENTMDFVTAAGAGTPSPESLDQGSNLNNNNGASTRQGQPDGFNDGILYTNSATVAGTYRGAVTAEPARAASDSDTERIQAMDLRVLKDVDTGAGPEGNDFVTGGLATFSLDIATSEYTSADTIEIVDTFPNGLCPVLPGGGAAITGDPLPTDCAYPSGRPDAALDGATATEIDYDSATGETSITLEIDAPTTIDAQDERVVTYTALMRAAYDTDMPYSGPTSSGDSLTNEVTIEGFTHSIDDLGGVTNGSGVPAFGDEDVWDDSSAEIVSDYSQIQKQVLPRDEVIDTDPATPTADESCDVAPGAPWEQNQDATGNAAFHLGDVVCYELTVDYAEQIDVRNPVVTDFLPAGVEYIDWAVGAATDGIDAADIVPVGTFGQRLQWEIGDVDADGDRIVELGSTLVLHVLGRVTSMTPNSSPVLDKPQNLLKYRQENVLGDVYFLRDASAIQTAQGPSLLKGVEDVDGDSALPARGQNNPNGTVFDSDRDGIQVVQGDVATFRVDLTGGDTAVRDLVVWDALPTGITKAAVSAVSAGGTPLNPGDSGYPATLDPAFAGRSVIVWSGIDLAAAQQSPLRYDVTVPAGAQIDVDYVNTASITQYDVLLNSGETETFFPTDSLDETSRPVEASVPGVGMRDDSDVYLPAAVVTKDLVGTEIGPDAANLDPNNGNTQAVAGELVTYRYSVSVPGNTTVANGVLRDRGPLAPSNRTFVPVSGAVVGGTPAGFAFTLQPAAGSPDAGFLGALRFPASYTNSTATAQVFTVELTGYIQRGQPIPNNTTLTNTAVFDSDSWDGSDTATVQYRTPDPQLTKVGTPENNVAAGQDIEYSITVENGPSRAKSYDNVIVDEVPVGLIVDESTISAGGVLTGDGPNGGGTITWGIDEIPATVTLTYTARIDPATGSGQRYVNTATVTGHTLPDTLPLDPEGRRAEVTDTDDATIAAIDPSIAKGVRTAGTTAPFVGAVSEPIGETVQYEVVVTLPRLVNFYAPRIVDDLPAGVELQTATVVGPTASDPTTIDGTWARTVDAATNEVTWTYDGNILSSTEVRTLTLRYDVLLSDDVAPNVNDLDNTAAFTWLPAPSGTRDSVSGDADVDVLNPVLAIDKQVSNTAPNPGQEFDYTVRVTNTGNTPAYDVVISDDVPEGVVVDADSISDGGVLTGASAAGGGTIEWRYDAAGGDDLEGPLYQATAGTPAELVLTYSATLAASSTIDDTETFTNVATVDEFASFPEDGRVYEPADVDDDATVDPPFPNVELTKTATAGDIAYAGTPFGWTLSARNTGDGPAQTVSVTDVLPKNWKYDAGSARIAIGGGASAALANPTVTTTGGVQTLVWSAADISATTPALTAGQAAVITFTATPATAALSDAGVTAPNGTRVAHVNTLSAESTDTSGATSNGSGDYTGPDDTADAFLHSADLVLDKNPAASPLVAGGAAGTAWTISVSNDGPDTAVGPFTVTDTWGQTGDLPEGFAVTGFAGTGWSCTPATDEGFSCLRTNAADTLASGASFPDIVVTAQATASMDPADAPVANSATVKGATFDPDEVNNTNDADVPVAFAADLRMVKTGPATAPNAGAPLTWTLTVTNNGAADSRSVAGDLVTVTDEIPAGVEDVAVGTLPTGWTSDAAGPLQPGDTVTFTLAAGRSIPATQSVAFTLTGTVDPSLTPGTEIENAATVNPGATDDPDASNNTDDTTVTPTTDTSIGVTKVRVVERGGAWVPADGLTPVPPVTPGTPVTYLVTVANTGTADARVVTVADEVEPYLSYDSLASVTGTWTRTSTTAAPGDDQAFALTGSLAPAASASFRVTFDVDPGYTGDVENTVEADADNADPDDASDDSGTQRNADLTIAKSHTGTVVAGESLDYTVTVTNDGPSDSSGPIEIVDTLPAGFTYAAGSATVSVAGAPAVPTAPVVDGQELTWTVGTAATDLAPEAQIVIELTANVDATVLAGTYVNVATVDGPDDTDPTNNTANDPTGVTTSADLSVVKSTTSAPHIAGEPVMYSLAVTNAGPSVARTVTLTDVVPAGLTVTAIAGSGWTCDVPTAACARAELPVGSSTITVTATIAASVPDGTELVNVATVGAATPDPTPANNTDDEEITVDAEADLALVKTAVDETGAEITTAVAGTDTRFLLEVQNNGPSDAVGPISIADTLPAGFTFVSIAEGSSAWTCATDVADPQALECVSPAGLAAGASVVDLVVVVALDPALPVGTSTNVAAVSSPTVDAVPGNNTDGAPLDVSQEVNLSIVKTHDAGSVRIGDDLVFDLSVANDGPSTATSVTVVDTLPAGLQYVDAAASDSDWSVVAAPSGADGTTIITATLGTALEPGATAPALQVAVVVTAGAYPAVTNVAVVAADQPDLDPTDDTTDDAVTVPPLAELSITKTAVGSFQAGSEARYVLTVTNAGPTEDPGPVVVTDVLPGGMRAVSASSDDAACATGQTVVCTVSDALAVGGSVSVTLVVALQPGAFPEVVNTATVASPTGQGPGAVLSSTVTTPVAADPLAATGAQWDAAWAATAAALALLGVFLLVVGRRRRVA